MYVCNCNGINQKTVIELCHTHKIKKPGDIFKRLDVQVQCALCIPEMEEYIKNSCHNCIIDIK